MNAQHKYQKGNKINFLQLSWTPPRLWFRITHNSQDAMEIKTQKSFLKENLPKGEEKTYR